MYNTLLPSNILPYPHLPPALGVATHTTISALTSFPPLFLPQFSLPLLFLSLLFGQAAPSHYILPIVSILVLLLLHLPSHHYSLHC